MKKMINYGRHFIDSNDIKEVTKALKKEKITTGNKVNEFENKISLKFKNKYSVVCNSGTSALFLAMKAINIQKNDVVVMPAINFISSYNITKMLGAKVFLSDVDRYTGQMTPEKLNQCCKKFKLKKVKAIVLMYNGGYPQNAERFYKFKQKFKSYIIEDACHAFGASYLVNKKKYMIGSCRHADISTFSLHPLKTITTGEGGVVTTNSRLFYERIKNFRSHNIIRDKKFYWKYEVNSPGLNFRLSDFQCALGLSQLKKINKFLSIRKKLVKNYNKELSKFIFFKTQKNLKIYNSSHHLYLLNIKNFNLKKKDEFIKYMIKNNVYLQYHYIPIYKFKVFKDKFLNSDAEKYYNETISLPIYFGLSIKDQKKIISLIVNYFSKKLELVNES